VFDIAVVGSLNLDMTVRVRRLPQPGETVVGIGRFTDTGGKGANQAVAACRLGRSVAMVGAVGADDAGASLLRLLTESGVDIAWVRVIDDMRSGVALITVAEDASNTIVVDSGANAAVDAEQVGGAAEVLGAAAVTIAQLEISVDAVRVAAERAGGTFLLNPAPGIPLPSELLDAVDVLVPNATELAVLTEAPVPSSVGEAASLARAIRGPGAVVVTLGSDGAVVVRRDDVIHVPAPRVVAVDPTAAGDAFCGGLADALVRGLDLVDAVRWAVRCGAIAVTRWGAQSSLPTRRDVESLEEE